MAEQLPNGLSPHQVDRGRIESAVTELIAAIGEDASRPGLIDTPRRVSAAYSEFFSGIGVDAAEALGSPIPVDQVTDAAASGVGSASDLVLVRDIAFRSICEHHLLPVLGRAHIAYLPGGRLAGLGRLALVVDTLASRPQLQERLTEEIADVLESALLPRGVLVVLDASHQCVTARGPRQTRSSTVTMAWRGAFDDAAERAVVLSSVGSSGE